MTLLRISVIVATLAVVGVWLIARGVRPRPTPVAAVRAKFFDVAMSPATVRHRQGSYDRLVAAIANSAGGRWARRKLAVDLALLELDWQDAITRIVTAALVVGLVGLAAAGILVSTRVVPSSVLWFALPVGLGLLAGMIMWSDVRSKAASARAEFGRAVNDFVQLVAVCLTTHRSIEESTRYAADAGDGRAFELIRTTLDTAPQMGLTVWEALAELGSRYQMPDLVDLAGSVARQAQIGVGVIDTVAALAAQMRSRALDELERAADKTDANLVGPTALFVFGMILFLAYPLATRITTAFNP